MQDVLQLFTVAKQTMLDELHLEVVRKTPHNVCSNDGKLTKHDSMELD